jgi:hypothetical protein
MSVSPEIRAVSTLRWITVPPGFKVEEACRGMSRCLASAAAAEAEGCVMQAAEWRGFALDWQSIAISWASR